MFTSPNIISPRSPAAKHASRSAASVGMNRQNDTECFAAAIAATIVSISVRCPAGSGENASRTCALPIVIGSDQPGDSFAVSAIDGFPASARARSLYSAASAGESNACSTFACSVVLRS